MKKAATILALTAALGLAACKTEDDNKNTSGTPQETTTQSAEIETPNAPASLTDQYGITVDAPVTRNGTEFTVSVNAACPGIELGNGYEAACTEAAIEAMQEKFMCSRFALAAGASRINNPAVLERGLQGTYREFPTHMLFTDEEFETEIASEQRSIISRPVIVITDVSDLDAAAFTDIEGSLTRDLCPDFP